MTQREIYKIIERLASGEFSSELELLTTLLREIVANSDIVITGARIWELHPLEDAYVLRFQGGAVEQIPEGYKVSIEDQPVFRELTDKRTLLNYESDNVLKDVGIRWYSATGVGELRKRKGAQYYQYTLAFNAAEMDEQFYDTINIIGSAVTLCLKDMRSAQQHEELQRVLDQAREIQQGLLPEHEARFRDYDLFGVSVPHSIVGGDYFDYMNPDENYGDRLGVVISDAASKGLPAAIEALFVSGALRMGMGFHTRISSLISRLNDLLASTFSRERFVTLFYCELTDSENGLVLYSNAGHCPPMHYRARTDDIRLLKPTGGILGILKDQKFHVENINMRPGDILLLYTDGILEAMSRTGELYGEQRLLDHIERHKALSCKEIAYLILEDVQQFSTASSYSDDKTLIVIKRNKSGKSRA